MNDTTSTQSFGSFYTAVVEILRSADETAALALLGMSGEAELVTLLEGRTTAAEALQYAKVMFEIGMDEVAHDVVKAVMTARIERTAWLDAGLAATA
jgi:hypothetical protein